MIEFDFNNNCYGCKNCENICPTQAIKIKENKEGFLMPTIDREKCIKCGACDKVCPYINYEEYKDIEQTAWYGCFMKDEEDRMKSTSGGIFPLLARYILKNDGLISGCIWNESMQPEHILTSNKKEIEKMRGSKYVQSNLQEIAKEIKSVIKTKKILFTGTPCQVAAIKLFAGQHKNLYTCSLICEGVASNKVWHKYKEHLELKCNSKLEQANFRYKKDLGWSTPVALYKFNNDKIKKTLSYNYDYYVRSFLEGLTYRNSCSNCQYKSNGHNADIIIGDLWGASKDKINQSSDKGISLVIVNSEKGKELFNAIKNDIVYFKANKEQAIDKNKLLMKPKEKHENREKFYNCLDNKNIIENIKENLKSNMKQSYLKEFAYKTKTFKILKEIVKK